MVLIQGVCSAEEDLSLEYNETENTLYFSRIEDDEETERHYFSLPADTTISQNFLNESPSGTLVATWTETSGEDSCLRVAFYETEWSEPHTVPDPLNIDSYAAVAFDTTHDVSIAYIAVDKDDMSHVRIIHYDSERWNGLASVYTTEKELFMVRYLGDGFGKEFISWENFSDKTLQVSEKKRGGWKVVLTQPMDIQAPHYMLSTAEGGFLLAWATPHQSIQTCLYEDGSWNYLEEIPLTDQPALFVLYHLDENLCLLWSTDTEFTSGGMACLVEESWQVLPLDLDQIFTDEEDYDL